MKYKVFTDIDEYTKRIDTMNKSIFSKKEKEIILSIFPDLIQQFNGNLYSSYNREDDDIYITKYSDEWYVVRIDTVKKSRPVRYLCDQFDGLIDCIKDIKNEKI